MWQAEVENYLDIENEDGTRTMLVAVFDGAFVRAIN